MAKQSTPKTMSSRLMTMKFMQRGAAAAAAAASEASSPATPRSDDGSAKRRKFSHTPSAAGSPAAPLYDQQAIQSALAEEEKKRQAAIEKRAAELGDSHWVLEGASALSKLGSRRPLNIVQVGFAQIDYAGASGEGGDSFDSGNAVQAQLRRFNMKKSKAGEFAGIVILPSCTDRHHRLRRERKTAAAAAQIPIPIPILIRNKTLKMRALCRPLETNRGAAGRMRAVTQRASARDPACHARERKNERRRSSLPGRGGKKRSN